MNAIVFLGKRRGRSRKIVAYSDTVSAMLIFSSFTDDKMMPQAITLHDKFIIILSQYIIFLFWRDIFRTSSRLLTSPPYPQKTIVFIPSGAKTQKIKIIDHNKCNVRASKNAEQAFSTQWYLYSGYGLIVLFSSVSSNESNSYFMLFRIQRVLVLRFFLSSFLHSSY